MVAHVRVPHRRRVGIGDVHFMIEGFDADCEATYVDDIVITRFSGSDEAAAGINRRANVNIDIR